MSALLRNLMGQITSAPIPEGEVVMDGLVFRLNGMNQGGVKDKWIDEIGKKIFDMKSQYGWIAPVENGFIFNGATGHYMLCETEELYPTKGTTIELCASNITPPGDSGLRRLFFQSQPDQARNWSIGISGEAEPYSLTVGNKVPGIPDLPAWNFNDFKKVSISITENSAFQNGQPLISSKTDFWNRGKESEMIMGSLHGTIHEVRIYNRILTNEERQFNYQHDNKTYLEAIQ